MTVPARACSSDSPLYSTSDLDGWRDASCHAEHNGLLVKRAFHGKWDAHQADIDACTARCDLENLGLVAHIQRHWSSDEQAVELEAAAAYLLAQAALPEPLSKQIFRDACSMGRVVASMCTSARGFALRLEAAGQNTCSRWHQDHFVGRALTSYTGVVGTEYTRDENVDFWELLNCGNNEHILRDPSKVEHVGVGDILFIKGKTYKGARPLVHRAPAKQYHADGRILNRLLLKVDVFAPNEGGW